MNLMRETPVRGTLGALMAAGLAIAVIALADPGLEPRVQSPPAALPVVHDTRTNLQEAFDREINAKERYETFAKQALREGYPAVASLFRACARAEQIHSEQDIHAIAWTGGEARARLERPESGSTAENLRRAIELETDEATQLYPAMLAQARAEHLPEAVRSLNFALGAERDHVRLLTAALETLEQRLPVQAFYVCPVCGETVAAKTSGKCPNCFTPMRKFERVN